MIIKVSTEFTDVSLSNDTATGGCFLLRMLLILPSWPCSEAVALCCVVGVLILTVKGGVAGAHVLRQGTRTELEPIPEAEKYSQNLKFFNLEHTNCDPSIVSIKLNKSERMGKNATCLVSYMSFSCANRQRGMFLKNSENLKNPSGQVASCGDYNNAYRVYAKMIHMVVQGHHIKKKSTKIDTY